MSTLEDVFISDSYQGLIHANKVALPATGQALMYDGSGQASSISIALSGGGATITGRLSSNNLTVGNLKFPNVAGNNRAIMVMTTNNQLTFVDKLSASYLADLYPNPEATYNGVQSITVNSKGLVTSVTTTESNQYELQSNENTGYLANTIYQNKDSRPLLVVAYGVSNNDVRISAYTGPTTSTDFKVADSFIVSDGGADSAASVTFIVPPNYHWRVALWNGNAGGTITESRVDAFTL